MRRRPIAFLAAAALALAAASSLRAQTPGDGPTVAEVVAFLRASWLPATPYRTTSEVSGVFLSGAAKEPVPLPNGLREAGPIEFLDGCAALPKANGGGDLASARSRVTRLVADDGRSYLEAIQSLQPGADSGGASPANWPNPYSFNELQNRDAWYSVHPLPTPDEPVEKSGVWYLPKPAADDGPLDGDGRQKLVSLLAPLGGDRPPLSREERDDMAVVTAASGRLAISVVAGELAGYAVSSLPFALDEALPLLTLESSRRTTLPAAAVPRIVDAADVADLNRRLTPDADDPAPPAANDAPAVELLFKTSQGTVRLVCLENPMIPVVVETVRSPGDYLGREPLGEAQLNGRPYVGQRAQTVYTRYAKVAGRWVPTAARTADLSWNAGGEASAGAYEISLRRVAALDELTAEDERLLTPGYPDGTPVSRTAGGPELPEEWRDGRPQPVLDAAAVALARRGAETAKAAVGRGGVDGRLVALAAVAAGILIVAVILVIRRARTAA